MTDEERDQIQILLHNLVAKEDIGIGIKELMDQLPDLSRIGKLKLTDILIVYDGMLEKNYLVETDKQVLTPDWREKIKHHKNPSKKRTK